MGTRWGFFDSQRAEGEAGLSTAAPFLEPQCHQAESFSARPAAPGCVPHGQGRPVVASGEGLGHRGRSLPAPARLPGGRTPPECPRRDTRRARRLTCPPSSPRAPLWRLEAWPLQQPCSSTSRGSYWSGASGPRPASLPSLQEPGRPVGSLGPWGPRGARDAMPPSRAAVPAARETGDQREVAGALTEAAFSSPLENFLLLCCWTQTGKRHAGQGHGTLRVKSPVWLPCARAKGRPGPRPLECRTRPLLCPAAQGLPSHRALDPSGSDHTGLGSMLGEGHRPPG